VVICLEQGADLHMAQLMQMPLTVSCFSKIQIGLPFWYRLTWVVPEKGPLNGCVCVCVCVCVSLASPVTKTLHTPSVRFMDARQSVSRVQIDTEKFSVVDAERQPRR